MFLGVAFVLHRTTQLAGSVTRHGHVGGVFVVGLTVASILPVLALDPLLHVHAPFLPYREEDREKEEEEEAMHTIR